MLICTGRRRNVWNFAFLRYSLILSKSAELYSNCIALLRNRIICTETLIITFWYPAAHLIEYFIVLLLYYTGWQLLRSSPFTYNPASPLCHGLLQRFKSSFWRSLRLSFHSHSISLLFSIFPSTFLPFLIPFFWNVYHSTETVWETSLNVWWLLKGRAGTPLEP